MIRRLLLDAICCCNDTGEIVLGAATLDLLVASGRADDLLKNGDALDLAWTDASAFINEKRLLAFKR